jgi:ABC-type lipoprotein export system ATPase subunit
VLITHEAEVAEAAGRTMRIRDGEILDADLVTSGGGVTR